MICEDLHAGGIFKIFRKKKNEERIYKQKSWIIFPRLENYVIDSLFLFNFKLEGNRL